MGATLLHPGRKEAIVVTLSSTDVAIRLAAERQALRITRELNARLGVEFWAISDERGLIEVALSEPDAHKRCGLTAASSPASGA